MPKIQFQDAREAVIEKLNNMISKRFDVGVQFIAAHTTIPQEIVYFETVRRNSGAPLIVTYNNMLIPVRVEGSLVGAVRVSDISHLNAVDISRVKETIELVMEESFVGKTLAGTSLLEQLESNVLPLRGLNGEKFATAN